MRKIAMVVGMLMISSSCVFAMPDRVGKVDAGFNVGGLLSSEKELDSSVYLGGSVSYGFTDWFALGVEGGWGDSDANFVNGGSGKVTRVPLFMDMIFRYTKSEYNYVPYGLIGIGALFTSQHGTGTLNSLNLRMDAPDTFAMKFGLGVDWFVNDKWVVNAEAAYIWASDDVELLNSRGISIDSADLDYWTITGGVKYLFD